MNNITKNPKYLSPLKHICMTIGELPSSYLETMSYYEMLLWFINYLQNTVIPTVNNNSEALQEVQSLYTELNNYVTTQIYNDLTNYADEKIEEIFNNLDVQEEVNKKLDEMLEDGTFDSIITRILPDSVMLYFDTLQDLIDSNLTINQKASTLGYYSKYDGGGAIYKIIEGTADNLFSYELSNGNVAELVNKKKFNVLQVGAKRNENYDNAPIFKQLFKSGLNDTTIYVPAGVYQTTTINYVGDNQETNNFNFIGIGNPIIKMIHPNAVKTTVETYSESYFVSKFIDTISTGNHFSLGILTLSDNNKYYYIKVDDKTLLPDSLVSGLVIYGLNSGCKAVISNIDKDDPDGEGTARIYLFETYNDIKRNNVFSNSSNTINENLGVREDLEDSYLYIRFNDNIIPSGIAVNRQIEQIVNGHKARIAKITTVYEEIKFIKLNCMPEESTFNSENLYLIDNTPFNINTYSGYTAGMFSLNKYKNSSIKGITIDGNNLVVSKYEDNANSWNSLITGGCKNITIENCNFINSIMAGIQIGGVANANAPTLHDYPENLVLNNCSFYNNGRGDIEIIYGKNITVSNCYGDGVFDIETNGTEILDNIDISNCNFKAFTPYSPSAIKSACFINVSDSKFFSLVVQGNMIVNLINIKAHQLQPQIATITGENCKFNLINGLHGNEYLVFSNSYFYGLYQTNPGGSLGNSELHFNNCIIDLSLTGNTNKLWNHREVNLSNCKVVSNTTLNIISDNNSTYKCYNTDFKNIRINGIKGAGDPKVYQTVFDSCRFLLVDNTIVATTSEALLAGNIRGGYIKNCYIEGNLQMNYSSFRFINCILNSTTKPKLRCFDTPYYSGIKSNDGLGISWQWVETGPNDQLIVFDDIQFSPNVPSNLGIKAGNQAVGVRTVADGCRGYYVGATDKALVRIYHNDTALAIKEISFS